MGNKEQHIEEEKLLRYLLGETVKAESEAIESWLEVSNDNRKTLNQLEALWLESGKLSPSPVAVNIDNAWEKVQVKLSKFDDKKNLPGKIITLRSFARSAAILIALFGIYQLFFKPQASVRDLVSGFAIVNDTLIDGSHVALNAQSVLKIDKQFNSTKRELELEGEAFFNVQRDVERPFIIHAGRSVVEVLGTSFNVKAYPDSAVEVFVQSGLVKLYMIQNGDTAAVMLRTGEKGLVSVESSVPEKVKQEPEELFWLNRTLVFKETKLIKVIDLLEHYYKVSIDASTDIKLDSKLSSTFKDENIENILDVIAASFELELRKDSIGYILERNEEQTIEK